MSPEEFSRWGAFFKMQDERAYKQQRQQQYPPGTIIK